MTGISIKERNKKTGTQRFMLTTSCASTSPRGAHLNGRAPLKYSPDVTNGIADKSSRSAGSGWQRRPSRRMARRQDAVPLLRRLLRSLRPQSHPRRPARSVARAIQRDRSKRLQHLQTGLLAHVGGRKRMAHRVGTGAPSMRASSRYLPLICSMPRGPLCRFDAAVASRLYSLCDY